MILFDNFRRKPGQSAVDSRTIHYAGFLDEIHFSGDVAADAQALLVRFVMIVME